MKIDIHEIAKVAGGYEYFYTIFDDDGKVLLGNQTEFIGRVKPTDSEIEEWKQARLDRYTQELKEIVEDMEDSLGDQELVDWNHAVRDIVADAIRNDPSVSIEDIQKRVAAMLGDVPAALVPGFVKLYTREAFDKGAIEQESFSALKLLVGKGDK